MQDNTIYNPLSSYKNIYKEKHNENTTNFIDELIKESKINIEENKETVKLINKLKEDKTELTKKLNGQNSLKTFLIIVTSVSIFMSIISLKNMRDNKALYISLLILGLLMAIGMLLLIFMKVQPKIKLLKKEISELDSKIEENIKLAFSQVKPLNELFYEGMSEILFSKTLPIFNMDQTFDSRRLDYLVNKFGLYDEIDPDRSTLFIKSGDINGNPFYIANDLVHNLGTKIYTGSITITYTTYVNVNGKRTAQVNTQVLTASLEKPCPYYHEESYIIYGNEGAPNLSFTRVDSDAEHLSQKQIDRLVKKDMKALVKKSQKSITKGGSFTTIAHDEFEVLWGATDRDNEVEFRLLFTPLAIKQLLELMKEKEIGFGDNFDFVKSKMINGVFPEHLKGFDLSGNPTIFYHYDHEVIKSKFVNYNNFYFKNVYFAFAPLLSIPLYQHQKPREYIYKDLYNSYVSFYEHEKVANKMNIEEFKHPLSNTRNILKTSVVKSGENVDTVKVTAFGYETENKIDYIPKYGNDGKTHLVPVHWVLYTPVSEETNIKINVIDDKKEETYRDKFMKRLEKLKTGENLDPVDLYLFRRFIVEVIKK